MDKVSPCLNQGLSAVILVNVCYEGKYAITYYDLDMFGHLKLSALLRMVHIAADYNATELGAGYNTLLEAGMAFVLQRFSVRCLRMPKYKEEVTIRTWPAAADRILFLRRGDMCDTAGNKLTEWASHWILFDVNNRKILKTSALPTQLSLFEDNNINILPEKILVPPGREIDSYDYIVRYSDMDSNKHMNNAIYGDVAANAVFDCNVGNAMPWREFHINYTAEAKPNEKITVSTVQDADCYYAVGKIEDKTSFTSRVVR